MITGNTRRRRIVTADEVDAHTSWRRVLCSMQRSGAVKAVKQSTNRRERREARAEIRYPSRLGE